jgi:integrase
LKTYGAAEVALTRLQGQVDQNRHPKTDITLGQAISRWLDIAKLEDTTRDPVRRPGASLRYAGAR